VCTKSQRGWLSLPHLPTLPPPVTAKQRVSEERIDSYGRKDFEKGKVLRREWKMPRERPTSGPGSMYDDGEELGDDEGSN